MASAANRSPGPAPQDIGPGAVAVLEREWRRTGLPGQLRRGPSGSVWALVDAWDSPVRINSPLSIAAILQYFPAPAEGEELRLLGILGRVLIERTPHAGEVAEWGAIVEVLRERAIPILRRESLALEATVAALQTQAEFDAYVAALKGFEASLSDPTGVPAPAPAGNPTTIGRRTTEARHPYLRPELADAVALLSTAEFVWRGSPRSTAGFWNLLCDDLAAGLRSAVADADVPPSDASPGGTREQRGRCLQCGAARGTVDSPGLPICVACQTAGAFKPTASARATATVGDELAGVLELLEAACTLVAAATTVDARARHDRDSGDWVLRALSAGLQEFARASRDASLRFFATAFEGTSEKGAPGA